MAALPGRADTRTVGLMLKALVFSGLGLGLYGPPDQMLARARNGRAAEERFRFAQPCVEQKCHNWTGRCGVIDDALGARSGGAISRTRYGAVWRATRSA